MKRLYIFALFAAFCASSAFAECDGTIYNPCAQPAVEFAPYRGAQKIVLGNGRVDRTYSIPVYFGYPIRSYHITGWLITHGEADRVRSQETVEAETLRQMARAAKLHGADAVILMPMSDRVRGLKDGFDKPSVFAYGLAITWRKSSANRDPQTTF